MNIAGPGEDEVDEIESVEDTEIPDETEGDDPDVEADQPDDEAEGDDESASVSFAGEEPEPETEERENASFRDLRKAKRDADRKVRELEQQLAASQPKPQGPGEEPTLEGCEFDEVAYKAKVKEWVIRKARADAEQAQQAQAAKAEQEAWQGRLKLYQDKKAELGFEDYEDAAAEVTAALTQNQRAIIVQASENSAAMVYGIGKNPALLKRLAAHKNDLVKFAVEIGKLEIQMKVKNKGGKPGPEPKVIGSSAGGKASGGSLARLEAEAERTGDRSKVVAFKRQMAAKKAA